MLADTRAHTRAHTHTRTHTRTRLLVSRPVGTCHMPGSLCNLARCCSTIKSSQSLHQSAAPPRRRRRVFVHSRANSGAKQTAPAALSLSSVLACCAVGSNARFFGRQTSATPSFTPNYCAREFSGPEFGREHNENKTSRHFLPFCPVFSHRRRKVILRSQTRGERR